MKIKVKFIGDHWPDEMREKTQVVEIEGIRDENEACWSVDSGGYDIEPVQDYFHEKDDASGDQKESLSGSISSLLGQPIKSLQVEFMEVKQ